MPALRALVIFGAGGLGSEVAASVQRINSNAPMFDLLGFCDDDNTKRGTKLDGITVLGNPEDVSQSLQAKPAFLCAVGNNRSRQKLVARMLALGWEPCRIVDPSVVSASSAKVGTGSYVAAGAILSPMAEIGEHVIVNFSSSITHNVKLEDFSQVAPGGRISGFGVVRSGAFVASNAVVAPGVTVGAWATLGACSFAMHHVPDSTTAVGIPARIVFRASSHQ